MNIFVDVFIVDITDMKYFLRKKKSKTDKIVFVNKTELKPKGSIVFGRCPAHNVLYAYINLDNFQERSERLFSGEIFQNI